MVRMDTLNKEGKKFGFRRYWSFIWLCTQPPVNAWFDKQYEKDTIKRGTNGTDRVYDNVTFSRISGPFSSVPRIADTMMAMTVHTDDIQNAHVTPPVKAIWTGTG